VKTFIILLAGGEGKRMNTHTKKQFLNIKGVPLFLWSVKTFLSLPADQHPLFYLVYSSNDKQHFDFILKKYLSKSEIDKLNIVEGSNTRSKSVFNGLKMIYTLASRDDFVLVHDCARPFIKYNDILNIIYSLDSYPAVTLGYSITDTIKQINKSSYCIEKHLNRNNLKGILTPQGFHFSVIWEAYKKYMTSPYTVTDDTQLVNAIGCLPKVINGDKNNIKITTQDDLTFANFYAEQYYNID
jgi:2-C-methyl-D-erythritol 4-phosphate cytidylyltransferase